MLQSLNYSQTKSHYQSLLSLHYTWMFNGTSKDDKNLFIQHLPLEDMSTHNDMNIHSTHDTNDRNTPSTHTPSNINIHNASIRGPLWKRDSWKAVDLGCGSGFQSIPLAELGAEFIYSIDNNCL